MPAPTLPEFLAPTQSCFAFDVAGILPGSAEHYYATFSPTLDGNSYQVEVDSTGDIGKILGSSTVQSCDAATAWNAVRAVLCLRQKVALNLREEIESTPLDPSTPVSTPVNPGEAETPEAPRG